MWGFWWIFPLMGILMCLAFAVMVFRCLATGRGGSMCIGGHGRAASDESGELRREIRALRDEIDRLKASR